MEEEEAMGSYTGTNGNDRIYSGSISKDVYAVPAGTSPSDDPDSILGGAGDDYLSGSGGNDTLLGGTGDDSAYGEAGDDQAYGDDGNDWLRGGDANDELHGGIGNDDLGGDTGDDRLYGDDGNDDLSGWSGNDTLYGGGGQDDLYGNSGNDIFVFLDITDSAVGDSRDVIHGWDVGVDKIDLAAIDANVDEDGHQAFTFMGTASSPGPGQMTLIEGDYGRTIVQLSTDADPGPESEIAIDDGYSVQASSYTAADFILS